MTSMDYCLLEQLYVGAALSALRLSFIDLSLRGGGAHFQ
jgi:hypothetical protein